jgi:type VII secretion protein EccE
MSSDRAGGRSPIGTVTSPGRGLAVRVPTGRIVVTQIAVLLPLTVAGHGPVLTATVGVGAVLVLLGTWVRLRRRWLTEWAGVGLRYLSRRRQPPTTTGPAGLLGLLLPGAALTPARLVGETSAVLSDANGLTALLELGDPDNLLADAAHPLPWPAALLPRTGPQAPPIRIHLLICGASTSASDADGGPVATSYRQLTGGRLLSYDRAVLAVRMPRPVGWSEADLGRVLSSTVRRIRHRLAPLPARPLDERAVLAVLAELAHHDGGHPVEEDWSGIWLGGLAQATYRLRRRPGPGPDPRAARRLVPRLLALPAAAVTVALAAGPRAGTGDAGAAEDLTVRLAARDQASLALAEQALRRLLGEAGAEARRLDGEQLNGLAATLPLGTLVAGGRPRSGLSPLGPTAGTGGTEPAGPAAWPGALDLPLGGSGLMIGIDRHRTAVVARLFRPEPTRVMLVGGVRAAQLVVLRAMALGARVEVRTARSPVWDAFLHRIGAPAETLTIVPAGPPVTGVPGGPLCPLLTVVDVGPVAAEPRLRTGWHTDLVIRDDLLPADVAALSRADLVILQPLRTREAVLAGTALGLGGSAERWFTRIRDDMIGIVNRRVLRWALLSATPVEARLVGSPARH